MSVIGNLISGLNLKETISQNELVKQSMPWNPQVIGYNAAASPEAQEWLKTQHTVQSVSNTSVPEPQAKENDILIYAGIAILAVVLTFLFLKK
jgi:hypothetical protein